MARRIGSAALIIVPAGIAAVIVAVIAAVIIGAVRGPKQATYTESLYDTRDSIGELTRDSDVIVVGTLVREVRTYKVPTPDEGNFSIRRDFEISVDRYLKGAGEKTRTLTIGVGMQTRLRGGTMYYDDRRDPPLDKGQRYVLFLRKTTDPGDLGPVAEPWRFRLVGDGSAEIHGPVRFTAGQFPSTERETMDEVAAAIAAASQR